ncbi:MAG: photosystem II stability/assembly factor-like uncharacterized protein [Saprospiraceae bacterium]|jgi:photosystem II stability/assembly factor-like uncharacterized protein
MNFTRLIKYSISPAIIIGILLLVVSSCKQEQPSTPTYGPDKAPGSWIYNQRAFPNGINREAKALALKQHKSMAKSSDSRFDKEWKQVGPINVGGRFTDISLHPTDKDIMYAGSAVGGVWKSIDRGFEWELVFEEEGGISIGNVEVSSNDPNTIYVGTGEANGSATSGAFFGNGMYKSSDAGVTWKNIGLPNSDHIGRILVHPEDSDIVYVAVAGKLYGKNTERGVYKTVNGGDTWEQALFISDSTAVIDISMSTLEPEVLFAASWERTRFALNRTYGGITSGIHRSKDGGKTWEVMTNGLPEPDVSTGRIGISVSPSDPNQIYTSYTSDPITNRFSAVYSSSDQGDSWTELNGEELSNIYSSFGWYFGNVRVHPTNPQEAYLMGLNTYQTKDGGATWNQWTSGVHVDQHGMEFHATDPDFRVIGNDGGIYITEDAGLTFRHVETIANNQLYECVIHPTLPETYFGGAQDNGTQMTNANGEAGYVRIGEGDGFTIKFDYINPNLHYTTSQNGGINRRTTLIPFQNEFIKPDADLRSRLNWNTPFVTIPNEENGILFGAEHILYSAEAGDNWEIISPDLTNGPYGSVTSFGTISAIAISEINQDIIVAGTDDGNVQITTDRGLSWTKVSEDLPMLSVSSVATDPIDEATIYVTYSGYRFNNYLPHVLKSTDYGDTWTDIGSSLPESPINEIVIDPTLPDHYYIASDESVYFSFDAGESWEILGTALPPTVFADLDLHDEKRELLAASYGRSMFTYDLPSEPISAIINALTESLNIYPNPSSDYISIDLTNNIVVSEITLLDISGRVMKNVSISDRKVDITSLGIGNYILRMVTQQGIISKKFTKI